ncbi:GGDEF domain-containing protein [Deinococcus aestuarii]|uniref:GGDEF domain-containing protein n=1 Tax=Deinococcus aestuarii TaxID=2774531 RepID=UPI001C0C80C0|nr:diguanylate cyclase [Deinococcus aestuarii]
MPQPHSPPPIFTPEYVRALERVFRLILPVMALTEAARAWVEWSTHPLEAGLNLLYGVVFLAGAVGLGTLPGRALTVIRVMFGAAVLVALSFDALSYRLLPPEILAGNTTSALNGRYLYQTYVVMVCSWLLFPVPLAGRLALGLFLTSLGLTTLATGHAVGHGQAVLGGGLSLVLTQAAVGGCFYLLLHVLTGVYTRHATLEHERGLLERYAHVDVLTDLPNRRAFDAALAREVACARREGSALSLVTFDLDHFKRVNDTYGHDVGDRVLVDLTALVRSELGAGEVLARWGGEEFVLLLPGVDGARAWGRAEGLRARVAAHDFGVGGVTVSLGVATLRGDEPASWLFKRADEALYAAKRGGRNRVGGAAGSGHPEADVGEVAGRVDAARRVSRERGGVSREA